MIDYSTPPPVVVVVTRPLPRDEGMAADHGVLEAGQFPRDWDQKVAKERAAQTVRSWAVQNEMRGVLGRVSAGAAEKILVSANPSEIRT